jgi:uncharacterized protein (TIGR03000 family)
MFSMVLMAALTTGTDMPDFGRRGGRGGCCGGYGGCYGMSYGGCYGGYGMGYGGCFGGGYGMGYGGCYGSGFGMGWGGCGGSGYGMAWGGSSMGWGGYGLGYGGYVLSGASPIVGTYASTPMISSPEINNIISPVITGNETIVPPGRTQSFYPRIGAMNQANEATIIVHVPEGANLTVDGQPTQSRSTTRIFHTPPLEQGKTYTYALHAEWNRDGHFVDARQTVEVRAGQTSQVTLNLGTADGARNNSAVTPDDGAANQITPVRPRQTRPINSTPAPRSFPTPPRDY